MNIVEQNWDQVLNKMKLEYCSSNISYTTWIAPLTVYEVKDNTVYILVKLKASLEHIQDKYLFPSALLSYTLFYHTLPLKLLDKFLEFGIGFWCCSMKLAKHV